MAPGLIDHHPRDESDSSFRQRFPDGIKTSGQHPPLYNLLRPYKDFPKQISGPTVWDSKDYQNNPERWTHRFTEAELSELSKAADDFIASGHSLAGITKEQFPLPSLSSKLEHIRSDLLDGKGFVLFKGFPVREWGNVKSAVAYMGLGIQLGYPISQNGRGHVLGHVKDLGEDSTQTDKVRIYRTNARQFFHTDDADLVGLLCIARALEGGESDIVSMHHVYNALQAERPDVVETLTQPIWYFDRKGETSEGEEEWIRTSILYIEAPPGERVYIKWDPYFITSLTRYSSTGAIPALSHAQQTALTVLEEFCDRLSLHMILDVGDIQILSDAHVLHARTAYKDPAPPAPQRQLMRLWLAVPEDEGGWKLPFWDSKEKKRGGIQVDERAAVAPLDAE
ncbi:MAG: hypothetical protein M1825_006357 [Sarcosagium campestre]|nr:MAG: hypothetical protein M1825_006357 [Sarcosagium campestre]